MASAPLPVALVTGCSSGIGRATALHLAHSGYRVFATIRTPEAEASLLREAEGLPIEPLRLELLDESAVARVAAQAIARGGRIDVLVNNAGCGQLGAVEDLSRDVLRRQFEVNVFAASQLCREVLPTMRAQRGGTIVNVSSLAGRVSVPFIGAYCASKFALEALTDALRIEARPYGVRVVLIEPGPVATRFDDAVRWSRTLLPSKSVYDPSYADIAAEPVSPRAARPERVAEVIRRAVSSRNPRARYRIRGSEELIAGAVRVVPTRVLDWGIARYYGLDRRRVDSPRNP